MYRVRKRDGSTASFDIQKVASAICKAFDACEREYTDSVIDLIALRITSDFEPKIQNGLVDVEKIQDSCEKVLSESGYTDVSKAYILYRKQRENVRNITNTTFDYHSIVDNYINTGHRHIEGNTTYSVGGLILSNSASITKNYWLSEVYDEEIASAHREGDIHIHDLHMLTGCNAGWSLKELIQQGLGGVSTQTKSAPAKHLTTLCNQIVNFFGIMQNEWAGAQSFSSFDTYLAPFIHVDHLSYADVKQNMESLIYGLNTPSRWGTISPFTNICFDWTVPEDLQKKAAIVGGKEQDFTYGDCKDEMDLLNHAFLEVLLEGDADGKPFAFPIPTYGISSQFDWDSENAKLLVEVAAKTSLPYFANFITGDLKQKNARSIFTGSHFNAKKLSKKTGGLFAYGENTGTVGTVSLNIVRIAHLARDEEDFYRRLDRIIDISTRALSTKRQVLSSLLDAGLYPYTKHYLGSFDNHFSSIGIVGMNEACLNAKWIQKDLLAEQSQDFVESVIMHIRKRLKEAQAENHELFSLEAIAAGDVSHRLAKLDVERYPDIQHLQINDMVYYTGGTDLPSRSNDDLFTRLDVQNRMQEMFTGGTSFDIRLDQSDEGGIAVLLKRIMENYTLPYIAVSTYQRNYPIEGYLYQQEANNG
ncbi:MAG: ribonucleoside triphosphate reductase [Erysipelotrichaceae bacterium]|nr:ribonucleoside triphosphate reductase [Erysipelotrichaceae bacterium]